VLRVIDLRGRRARGERLNYAGLVPRAEFNVDAAMDVVRPICHDIAQLGAPAIAAYSLRFDHVVPESFRVDPAALRTAFERLDDGLRSAFETAIDRRRTVSEAERGPQHIDVDLGPGAQVSQRLVPVRRVGLYVPGGLAPLASSVIMNVVPAQVAGVPSIALASPPHREFGGLPHPNVLALCHLLGVDEVYAVGGAQAIAMFAYGVPGHRWIWSPGLATSMWSRPSVCSAAGSISTPRPARPRSQCWPTGPPCRCTSPPT
jgi:histidinol dehydrogenase